VHKSVHSLDSGQKKRFILTYILTLSLKSGINEIIIYYIQTAVFFTKSHFMTSNMV
jgi:hypothetical protein